MTSFDTAIVARAAVGEAPRLALQTSEEARLQGADLSETVSARLTSQSARTVMALEIKYTHKSTYLSTHR